MGAAEVPALRSKLTMTEGTAVPIFCAGCREEISMPCTYVIRTWPRGSYHLGCEPMSGSFETGRERVEQVDGELTASAPREG
jgi:hypothetical protein